MKLFDFNINYLMEKNWIDELKEKSWEIEVLISGGAIFTLFKLTDFLIPFFNEWSAISPTYGLAQIQLICFFALKVLTVGFAFHLIARGYWLSVLCLDYFTSLNQEKQRAPRQAAPFSYALFKLYNHQVIDRFCGILMYLSITYAIAIIGLSFLISVIYTAPIFLYQRFTGIHILERDSLLSLIFALIALTIVIYIFDFLIWRIFRRVKYLSYLLFPIFHVYDYLSLRFLYARSFSLLIQNVPKLQFRMYFMMSIFISSIFTYSSLEDAWDWPRLFDKRIYKSRISNSHSLTSYYRDETSLQESSLVSIQRKTINQKTEYLEIHIPYTIGYDDILKAFDNNETSLSDLITIEIDDSTYQYNEWTAFHSSNNRHFLLGMIDVSHLAKGKHYLRPRTQTTSIERVESNKIKIQIPFWIK